MPLAPSAADSSPESNRSRVLFEAALPLFKEDKHAGPKHAYAIVRDRSDDAHEVLQNAVAKRQPATGGDVSD